MVPNPQVIEKILHVEHYTPWLTHREHQLMLTAITTRTTSNGARSRTSITSSFFALTLRITGSPPLAKGQPGEA